MTQTLTFAGDGSDSERRRAVRTAHQLVVAMDCARPCARPARFSLADVDEVLLGRGPERNRVRVREGTLRRLRIHVPDGFMSATHVRLVRENGGWHAEDAGSKNGTSLNDARLERARLEDGDMLAAGSTLLMFRSDMPVFDGDPDLDLTGTSPSDAPLATLNAALAHDFERLMRVAASPVPLLIQGDTGTGKELVARAVHRGARRAGAFVAVNCGALPATLIASELFGARKGAYSGATEDRTGFVRAADGGTLFLDEIAELPLEAQAALLRVLQEREVVPVGGNQPVKVDVRVIAATHRDLSDLVARERFREDLFGRVAGYRIGLPALRERREDIGLIVGTLLEREDRRGVRFQPEAARALFHYGWPRNVRELEHALLSVLAVAGEGPIARAHLPEALQHSDGPLLEPGSRADFVELMREHQGNVSAVARALGTSRSQVRRIAKRLGVDAADFRRDG